MVDSELQRVNTDSATMLFGTLPGRRNGSWNRRDARLRGWNARMEGEQMRPRVIEVAARAGVSASTVSNFLHRPEVVSPATQERVREAIAALRYVPNYHARQLRSGLSRTIGLLLLDAWSAFYAELSRGVEDFADERGWTIMVSNTRRNEDRERRNLDMYEAQRVRGILIVPQGLVGTRLRELRRAGTSCVVIEQWDPPSDIPSVTVNDTAGGSVAAEHLVRSGRRRLAFAGDPGQIRHVNERWQGFRAAVFDSTGDTPMLVRTQDLTMKAGLLAAGELLVGPPEERPDGVFAANDLVALGILQACMRAGVRVPDDIAIVGFDDIEFAAQAAVPLTTVKQPAVELGRTAAELLIEDMEHGGQLPPKHVLFEPKLIVRQSAP